MTAYKNSWMTAKATYEYEGYPIQGTSWNQVPGNYIFSKFENGEWKTLYAGKTESFKDRFSNHEKLPAAIRLGATHIFVRVNKSEAVRAAEELDIISSFRPPLNDLLK